MTNPNAPRPRLRWFPGSADLHWLDKIEPMPFDQWMAGWQVARVKRTPWRADHFRATMGLKHTKQGHHWWMNDPDPELPRSTFYWSQGFPSEHLAMVDLWGYIHQHQRRPGVFISHQDDDQDVRR